MRKCFKSAQRGQSLVEFAIILPAFLLMAVMVFDLGRAVYYSSTLQNAAREAARYGIVHPTDETGMKAAAINYAVGLGIVESDIQVNVMVPENKASFPLPHVTVIISYDFYPATPLVSNFMPDPASKCDGTNKCLILHGEATMKLEALP